jgi:hypothetical protein
MKQPLSVAFLLCCAVAGFAQQSRVQVAGIVRSATTGEAVKSAVVILRSTDAKPRFSTATTGADGIFSFSGLAPGRYQLTISKSGYQTFQANTPITILSDGTEAARLAPSLWPNGAISGRVIDWDGEPVAAAEVRAYAVVYQVAGTTLSLATRAESDDLGDYRLFDLPAGKYVIQVSPPRTKTPSGQFYADAPAVYYPGATGPAQAPPIELHWGEDATRVDVRILPGQSYAIGGVVWDAFAEGPCTRCLVQAVQHDGVYNVSLPQTAHVYPNGAFVLRGLSSGDYSVVARRSGSKDSVAQNEVMVRGRHVEDARLVVGLHQPVTGQVVLENPPEGIDVTGWTPSLSPVALPQWWPHTEGEVNANRQFTVQEVAPARYRFELDGLPAGAYLKTLRAGGQPLANPEIVVSQETPVSGLQAVIGFDGATVQGQVRAPSASESAQFVQARVFLIPQQTQAGFQVPRTTEAAPDGSFSFASVSPGSYTLYALPAASSLQILDPAVQAALDRYATRVDLDPNETASVALSLPPQPGQ